MQVVREYYPDHTDKTVRFGMIDVKPLLPTGRPVTLAQIKTERKLSDLGPCPTITALCSAHSGNALAHFMQNGQDKTLTNEVTYVRINIPQGTLPTTQIF